MTRRSSACALSFLAWLLAAQAGCGPRSADEVRVVSDRTASHLEPLFEAYTKATGIAVRTIYLDEGLITRLESRPTEADIVITRDADLLEIARQRKLLQRHGSRRIEESVPAEFRDTEGTYFSDSYRARVIYYSKERVRPEELSTYEDLASERWKGRVCIRSGYHDYNVSLFGQLIVKEGREKTRAFMKGLASNLARTPLGNDRDQARGIFEKVCDVAIANSYYMGIMLSSRNQREWGQATRVFFPNQSGCGSYILRSGLALTTSKRNVAAARALLEYMVQGDVQAHMSKLTFAYPVDRRQPMPALNKELGRGQPGVRDGVFKVCQVPLDAVVQGRDGVIRMLDEIGFDQPR